MMDPHAGRYFSLGLIGYPLGHSLSPILHTTALRAVQLYGQYQLYPIPPLPQGLDGLRSLLEQVRQGMLVGLNVTIPHKESILHMVDCLTPTAQAVGAVNTLYEKSGRLVGDNTDVPGFLADLVQVSGLESQSIAFTQRSALLLGAGGAARAVAYALVSQGWQVWVAARRLAQAQFLADSLDSPGRKILAIKFTPDALAECSSNLDLVVNCTPLGMTPACEANPWPVEIPLPANAFIYDLVYNPAETALVHQARQCSLPAANGLGMLVEQAALAFTCWTGIKAPRQIMMEALLPERDR